MEKRLLGAVHGPVPSQVPGGCAGWDQGQGAGEAVAWAPLDSHGGNSPIFVPIFAPPASAEWWHCCCHLIFSCCSRWGWCYIFKAQHLLGFSLAAEKAYFSSLMLKGAWSLSLLLSLLFVFRVTNPIHFKSSIVHEADCFYYIGKLFIQDVHGLFKAELTTIPKIISDVCLRILQKWGFNVLTMHLGMTFTSIL